MSKDRLSNNPPSRREEYYSNVSPLEHRKDNIKQLPRPKKIPVTRSRSPTIDPPKSQRWSGVPRLRNEGNGGSHAGSRKKGIHNKLRMIGIFRLLSVSRPTHDNGVAVIGMSCQWAGIYIVFRCFSEAYTMNAEGDYRPPDVHLRIL